MEFKNIKFIEDVIDEWCEFGNEEDWTYVNDEFGDPDLKSEWSMDWDESVNFYKGYKSLLKYLNKHDYLDYNKGEGKFRFELEDDEIKLTFLNFNELNQ
jgi:hypothetical protein